MRGETPLFSSGGETVKKVLILLLFSSVLIAEATTTTIIFIGEPGAGIYVNASFVGVIGSNGRLSISLRLGQEYTISTGGDWYIQIGEPDVVKIDDEVIVFLHLTKASRLRILSNVYPVSVFVDDQYYGEVKNPDDTVKVPAGYRRIVLKAEGYKEVEIYGALEWKKVVPISAKFEKLPEELKIYLSSDEFSPNGDWYNDVLNIHIYSTFESSAFVTIKGENGIVFEKNVDLSVGDNIITWDGKGVEDGEYTIEVKAGDLSDQAKVKLDRSKYTYRKEITIATLLTFLGLTTLITYLSIQQ
jgi:hypothetical protein